MDIEKLKTIITEARKEAKLAAIEHEETHFPDGRFGMCGFAWVILYQYDGKTIKGNTKIGRTLKQAGIEQNWERRFHVWNPSGILSQNIDTLEQGARAYAKVLNNNGFYAYVESRLD